MQRRRLRSFLPLALSQGTCKRARAGHALQRQLAPQWSVRPPLCSLTSRARFFWSLRNSMK